MMPALATSEHQFPLESYLARIGGLDTTPVVGRVIRVVGLLVESIGPAASLGEICEIRTERGVPLSVEVVGFRDGRLLSVPLGDTAGIRPGDGIVAHGGALTVGVGAGLLGRVIDGLGRPIDGRGPVITTAESPLRPPTLNPMAREPITVPLGTGVRAIDALLTCGRGQRMGLVRRQRRRQEHAARHDGARHRGRRDRLGLIGERGREVSSFIEDVLGPRGLERSVVVVVDGRQPAARAHARGICRHRDRRAFPRRGQARAADDGLAHALRHGAARDRTCGRRAADDQGLSAVGVRTAPALRRARRQRLRGRGSITGVLHRARRRRRPQRADRRRGARHSRRPHRALARPRRAATTIRRSIFLHSISRTMPAVTSVEHRAKAAMVREWLAALRDNDDLINVGAYVAGSNARIDAALARRESMERFLCQSADMGGRLADAIIALNAL